MVLFSVVPLTVGNICHSLCYSQAHCFVIGFTLFFFRIYYLSHFTGVASPVKINMDHHSIHKQNQANAEQYCQIGLAICPCYGCSALNIGREVEIGNPHIGEIETY